MLSSDSSSPPLPADSGLHALWSRELHGSPRGISLIPERNWLLAWDQSHWLYLLDQSGNSQAQRHLPRLSSACAASDASAYAAIGEQGQIWWLAPDLMARWERQLPNTPLAVAVDSFGQYLAVSDNRSFVHLFDRPGQAIAQLKLPRPLRYLTFIPAAPAIVGSADFGLVVGLDVHGHVLWQDGLVASVGGIATDGMGEHILFACFGEGLQHYDWRGKKQTRINVTDKYRLVRESYDGKRLLAANMKNQVALLSNTGQLRFVESFDAPIVDLEIGALGTNVYVALENGPIKQLSVQPRQQNN